MSAGHQAIIVDPVSGAVLLSLTASAAGVGQNIDFLPNPETWSDFEVSTLTSGALYVYFA
ncbi:MAG: hypothetical protein WB985_07640 [Candidatus Acidiferrales bacterium]